MTSVAEIIPKNFSQETIDTYNVERNTFIAIGTDNLSNKFEVEVGDIKQDDFYPQVKLKRWDNECNFSVRLIDDEIDTPIVETDGNKIKYFKEKAEAHFYNVPKIEEIPECYEFEIILKERPLTNLVQMSIETKELVFYYQPELTQEQKDTGMFRPDDVIGSYAVYHKSKQGNYFKIGGKNYTTGKAFHIYRPKITDNSGKEIWGKLNVDVKKKLLTIEIPPEFLNDAVYPVIVDPTFGNTNIGGSTYSDFGDKFVGSFFAAPENGTADSISFFQTTANNQAIQGLIYDKDNSNAKIDRVCTDPCGGTSWVWAWFTQSFASPQNLVSGTGYWLVISNEYGFADMKYDSGAAGQGGIETDTWAACGDAYPDPYNPTTNNNKYSIYCTYSTDVTVKPMWYYDMLRRRNQ